MWISNKFFKPFLNQTMELRKLLPPPPIFELALYNGVK